MGSRRWSGWLRAGLACLALCAVPVWLAAQQGVPPEKATVEAAQKLEKVKQTLESKRAELSQLKDAKDDAERRRLHLQYTADVRQLLADARAIAESAPGTETAAEAWGFLLSNAITVAEVGLAEKALDTLTENYLASPAWKDLSEMLGHLPKMGLNGAKVEKALRILMEKSPHKRVQAAAMYSLGTSLLETCDDPKQTEGRALLVRVQQDFALVKEAQDCVARAEGTLFQSDKLQPWMRCPDFEATDEAGTKFKLSDYKGKVVLIDFWGYW